MSMRSLQIAGVALFLAAGSSSVTLAQDYLGASAVLQQVKERNAKPDQQPAKNEASQLADDIKSFGQSVTNLTPEIAAQRWLDLVDRAGKVLRQSAPNNNGLGVQIQGTDLLGVLPPPNAWDALATDIAARPPAKSGQEIPEAGLQLLATTLTGDVMGRNRVITNLQAKAQDAGQQAAYAYHNNLEQLGQAILNTSADPDAIVKSLQYQLVDANGENVSQIQVPNLVSEIGPDKAEIFLRKALVMPNVQIQFTSPNETSRLAQKLALELMDQIKTPQWGLINSLDAVALYEAMDKKFGAPTNNVTALPGLPGDLPGLGSLNPMNDFQRQGADIYYLAGLISLNRTQDAVVMAKKIKGENAEYSFGDAFKAMSDAGYTTALDSFLHELLSQDAALPFWDQYVEVAADAGQTERMLALVRAAAGRPDLSDKQKANLHQILFKALLAADDTDGAVQEARRLDALDGTTPSNDGYAAGQLGVMLARVGILLHKPELTAEGIGIAKKWLATVAGSSDPQDSAESVTGALVQILLELKRGPEAESLLTDALAKASRHRNTEYDPVGNFGGAASRILTELITVYYLAGRYDDVLALLEQSPDWGARDLSELLGPSAFDDYSGSFSGWGQEVSVMSLHNGASPLPVPYIAAVALAAKGQKEPARKIDDALLDQKPALDRGYELLLELDGTNAIPRLDELFARDQFEKRPLIWKAHLLRQENQLDAAEKVIRQAIAIDPSDGESGRGDRMRAYAELADILDARGNNKDAGFYREIVKAIRMAEDADQFYLAGLLKHAIGMYEQALNHFSDAYCIQSRLAIQLAALGQNEQAEEHYRRAYELMPDSFGRVESHCFGCERAFDGGRAQGIAEKVFTQLVAERPNKPQVHYLLGYLRSEEERYNEALTNYLTAVRLDPDYLNAWVKAQEAANQTLMPPRQRDEITFNIVRLDPLQRHASAGFDRVSDLKGLWQAVAAAASQQPVAVTNLLMLAASAAELDKKESSPESREEVERARMMARMQAEHEAQTPAAAVARTPFVSIVGQMIMDQSGEFMIQ